MIDRRKYDDSIKELNLNICNLNLNLNDLKNLLQNLQHTTKSHEILLRGQDGMSGLIDKVERLTVTFSNIKWLVSFMGFAGIINLFLWWVKK